MDIQKDIVFQGKSKKGREFIIRYPSFSDAEAMWKYINALSQERTFISFQGEEVSLEKETKYMEGQMEKMKNNVAVILLAFIDDVLVGIGGIEMKERIDRHIGVFGISLAKEYRGEGIGSQLMDTVISEAVRWIPTLEIISLTLFSNNEKARNMYEKKGFKQYGNLPNGVKLEKGYVDHEFMYKVVRLYPI